MKDTSLKASAFFSLPVNEALAIKATTLLLIAVLIWFGLLILLPEVRAKFRDIKDK